MDATTLVDDVSAPDANQRLRQGVAKAVGDRPYAMWFDRTARFRYLPADQTVRVAVPNRFVADWIDRHYHDDLRGVIDAEFGAGVAVDIQIDQSAFDRDELTRSSAALAAPAAPPRPAARRVVHAPAATTTPAPLTNAPLRHRLEHFVVGASNELAYAAATRMAEDEHIAANPLFLHGGCGLGKTHLLQGICRRYLEQHPGASVVYTTGEQFTNEYITAIRNNKLDTFRRKMRGLDLLAVDDVHFIANKQATQQEFLHSFDAIELSGSRLVLASDSHPKLISQFSDALVSRCIRGLVVQIRTPDESTRRKLILQLAQRKGMLLQDGVVARLAEDGDGSVRELEGLLTKLHALSSLLEGPATANRNQAIGHALLDKLFEGERRTRPRRPVRFEAIASVVCEEIGVDCQKVIGTSRHRHVVLARSLVIHLARELTSMSYPEIAAAMSRKNHSTIITAAQRMTRQIEACEPVLIPGHRASINLPDLVRDLKQRLIDAA